MNWLVALVPSEAVSASVRVARCCQSVDLRRWIVLGSDYKVDFKVLGTSNVSGEGCSFSFDFGGIL